MNSNFGSEIMLNANINTQSPIAPNIGSPFAEGEKSDTSKLFWQSTEVLLKFAYPTATAVESVSSPSSEEDKQQIPVPSLPQKRLAFPTYDQEDILKWDVSTPPPPRPSGTIRVRLKFKGRRKPIPIEDPSEE